MNTRIDHKRTKGAKLETFLCVLIFTIFVLGIGTVSHAVTVSLQWGASTGATGYKVYYQADTSTAPFSGTGASEGSAPVDVANQTSASISGLDPAHAYYFAVTAYNTAGESSYSNIVSVPEQTSPTTSISYPANNASVGGTVAITASATDNVGVTSVGFYVNGVLQGTDTSAPYTYSWNTSSLASGTYTLTSRAYDAAGNVGQSSAITVSVSNSAIIKGDVNRDGKVDVSDALLALHMAVGLVTPSAENLLYGNVAPVGSIDNMINIQDVMTILAVASGKITL